jgi:lysophospholipase L1-like esterase
MKLIFKVILAMICALGLWEVILENTIEKSPGFTAHPVLGRINKPGTAVVGIEGFSRTRINSLGMRGDEIPPKSKNEYRILCLGDSNTKALQVADNKTYAHLLQEKLRVTSKSRLINTINGGRDGASPAHFIQLANFYKSEIQPDFVVVEVDDVSFSEFMTDPGKQFHVIQDNGTFKPVYIKNFSSDNALSKVVLNKFPKLSFLLEYSVVRVGGDNLRKTFSKEEKVKNNTTAKLSELELQHNEQLVDWTVQQLKDKYKEKLVIMYFPFIDYHNLAAESSSIEKALKASTNKYRVKLVDMRQSLLESYKLTHQPAFGFNNTLPGTGHLNEIGHQLIANDLANFFNQEIGK